MSRRFRIEIDIEVLDTLPEAMVRVRVWICRLLARSGDKRILNISVVQTHPEQLT